MTDETKETKQASDCGETQEQSAPPCSSWWTWAPPW